MKIAWMVNNINQMGGIERVVCGLSSHFCAALNHSVEIISINSFEDHLFFSIDPSVRIRHCGVDWRECTFRTLCHTVRGVMEELDADILLTCHPTISYAVLLNKRKFAGKVIVTQHSANDSFSKKRLYMNALMFRLADRFVVLSDNDKKSYSRLACKSQVIPNANFKPAAVRSTLDSRLILAAGRIEEVKGFDMLIDAFAGVALQHPEWKLCICGGGSCEESLKKQVAELELTDRVLFPGVCKNMSEYYEKASVFALTSRSEGFSLVLIEAMSHGVPVVSFDLPAPMEICGEDGALMVPGGEIQSLSEALSKLMSSDELRNTLGENAYRRSERYSLAAVSGKWMSLFRELLNR